MYHFLHLNKIYITTPPPVKLLILDPRKIYLLFKSDQVWYKYVTSKRGPTVWNIDPFVYDDIFRLLSVSITVLTYF